MFSQSTGQYGPLLPHIRLLFFMQILYHNSKYFQQFLWFELSYDSYEVVTSSSHLSFII